MKAEDFVQNINLLYEVDVIEEEFNAQEKVKRHIRFLFPCILPKCLWGQFGQFGIRLDEEKLIFCDL